MFDCIKIEIDIEEIWMVLTILTDNEYYLWLWSSVTVVPFYRFWLILVHIRHYSLLRWIQWVRPIWFTCFLKTSWYLRAVAIFFFFAGKCDPTRTFRANEAEGSSLSRDGWWGLLGCHRLHCELFEYHDLGFNGAETNCGIAHISVILLMNSCDT